MVKVNIIVQKLIRKIIISYQIVKNYQLPTMQLNNKFNNNKKIFNMKAMKQLINQLYLKAKLMINK